MLLFDAYHDEYRQALAGTWPCWAARPRPFVGQAGTGGACACARVAPPPSCCAAPRVRRRALLASVAGRQHACAPRPLCPCRCSPVSDLQMPTPPPPPHSTTPPPHLTHTHRGVVCLVEVLDGRVQKGDRITAASTGGLADETSAAPGWAAAAAAGRPRLLRCAAQRRRPSRVRACTAATAASLRRLAGATSAVPLTWLPQSGVRALHAHPPGAPRESVAVVSFFIRIQKVFLPPSRHQL